MRSDHCGLPEHLGNLISVRDKNADDHWNRVEQLPIVLSHRDFWMKNILFSDGKVVLIDWDTTGWGYWGEDIITLIADTDEVENIIQYYEKCFSAYRKGFMEYADISYIPNLFIYERMVIYYSYRLIAEYMYAETPERKELKVKTLQKIYEMKDM
jgi:thiamine kinase-like enzyme